jgi:hypothetical protein
MATDIPIKMRYGENTTVTVKSVARVDAEQAG